MLDPAKRKCGGCYEERDKWGIPIPNCLDPDGLGSACPYPEISTSIWEENVLAIELWRKWGTSLVEIQASFGAVIYTLNLALLEAILKMEGVREPLSMIVKLGAVFQEWRAIQMNSDAPKTKDSFQRLEKAKKLNR